MASEYPREYDDFDGSLKDVCRGQYLYVDGKYFNIVLQLDSREGFPLLLFEFWVDKEGEVYDDETLPMEDKELYGY